MKKTIYNLHALVCVDIRDKKKITNFVWKENPIINIFSRPLKFIFKRVMPTGFYWDDTLWTQEQIEKSDIFNHSKMLFIDNCVYYQPYVKLHFSDGQKHVTEFSSYDEALAWGNKQAGLGMDVKLEIGK